MMISYFQQTERYVLQYLIEQNSQWLQWKVFLIKDYRISP